MRDVARHEHLSSSGKLIEKIVACATLSWLAKTAAPRGVQQAVRNPRNLGHFCNVVHAYDVRPAQNAGSHACGSGPGPLLGRPRFTIPPHRTPHKPPPPSSHHHPI